MRGPFPSDGLLRASPSTHPKMQSPDMTVEFTAGERRRAAEIDAEFTPEERERVNELYATIAELEKRQEIPAVRLVAMRAAKRRTWVRVLERELLAVEAQTEGVLDELTAILAQGIERARTNEEAVTV